MDVLLYFFPFFVSMDAFLFFELHRSRYLLFFFLNLLLFLRRLSLLCRFFGFLFLPCLDQLSLYLTLKPRFVVLFLFLFRRALEISVFFLG